MNTRQSAVGSIAKKTKVLLKGVVAPPAGSDGFRDRIAARAHALYVERGYRHGCDLQDWLDAEREVLSQQLPG